MPPMKTAFFTICSRNYLAYALTLRESLLAAEPDRDFIIFLADEAVGSNELAGIKTIAVAELGRPEIASMALRYSIMEFNTAIKPFCFEHLFRKMDFEAAIYLDPDIEVFHPLTQVHEALQAGASCILTPHILEPLEDEFLPSDLDILKCGTFNLGFAAFARTAESEDFISWWAKRLIDHCFADIEHGLFVDQKFVEFAPSFIRALHVLRDPGHNVAYWNLAHRTVEKSGNAWQVNGQPLVFFHFSGIAPGRPELLSKHQNRFQTTNEAGVKDLVEAYLDKLSAHSHATWSKVPYAFNAGPDGQKIPDTIRRHLAIRNTINAPLSPSDVAYWNAPSERVDQVSGAVITRLMLALYESRPDLRTDFPLSTGQGRRSFHAWFLAYGGKEYGLSDVWIEAALASSLLRSPALSRHLARLRLGLARLRRRIFGS